MKALLIALLVGSFPAWAGESPISGDFDPPPYTPAAALGLVVASGAGNGIVVQSVEADSAAAQAGFQAGDLVLLLRGKALGTSCAAGVEKAVAAAREAGKPLVELAFSVRRGKAERTLEIRVSLREIDVRVAVTRALDYLAREIERDPRFEKTKPRSYYAPIIYAPLAGLAFVCHGSTLERGRYAAPLRTVLAYVVAHGGTRKPEQDAINKAVHGNICSLTHNAGFNAMFLAQLLEAEAASGSAAKKQQIRAKLRVCCNTLEKLALPNGGWQHGSGGANPLGYTHLVAATVTALNGLEMAVQAGVKVDKGVIERGLGYLRAATSGGEVGYALGNRGSFSAGRNAAALQCLCRAGLAKDPLVAPVLSALGKNLEKAERGHGSPTWHMFYIALALARLDPKRYDRFYALYGKRLLANQQPDGSFAAIGRAGGKPGQGEENRVWGPLYTTPLIALALLAPYRPHTLLYRFTKQR